MAASSHRTVIVSYARTPFVKFNGQFARISAVELGATAIRAALERASIVGSDVERVFAGQVLQAAAGQNPGRQAATVGGIPLTVPAITLNAVCLSGMEAVVAGTRLIDSGEVDIVVAVGQESMTLAPHALGGSRAGLRYGSAELVDTMQRDGLTDAFEQRLMGASTEARNVALGLSREEQDEWAAASHHRLAASMDVQAREIVGVEVRHRGNVTLVVADDGLRADTDVQTLGRLQPAFSDTGSITAGNSSPLTDGAAALVLMSSDAAAACGVRPLARVLAHSFVAGPDVGLHAQPANAIRAALVETNHRVKDLAAIEINEAFAAVPVHSTRELGADPAIVNTHGGAIALGHPLGASGARIVGHTAMRLLDAGTGSVGAAALCAGGGQGAAVVLQAL